MIYKSAPINSVIARIIRNTRIQDSSYIHDIKEWIPEAMGLMKTKTVLSPRFEDVKIYFHRAKLPCSLHHIQAVEYNGHRIREGSSVKAVSTNQNLSHEETVVESTMAPTTTPEDTVIWSPKFVTRDAAGCNLLPAGREYYFIEMDYISTSFSDGCVRIFFAAQPVDDDGLPLIPDNENYKQALYNYCRAMMIGAGYHDTVYSERELMQRFETYAARAIDEIRYPSVDSMEDKVTQMVRFIPQANYFENYFKPTQEQNY